MKHIIWSNMNLDLDDWKDFLEEEYPEITDEHEQYHLIEDMNMEYLDECLKYGKYRKFSCKEQKYGDECSIDLNKPVLIEGTYSFMHDGYDLRIFLECSKNIQLERLKTREEDIVSFENIWLVKERDYFNRLEVKNKANLIINTDKLF